MSDNTTKALALITGASGGIGEALAHVHARRGGDLVLVARNQARLEQLKTTLEARYHIQATVIAQDLAVARLGGDYF